LAVLLSAKGSFAQKEGRTPTEQSVYGPCVEKGAYCATGNLKEVAGKGPAQHPTAAVAPAGAAPVTSIRTEAGKPELAHALTATSTAFGISPNPASTSQAITFFTYVTAASGTPSGTVTFLNGTKTLGTATLAYGAGSFTLPANSLAAGTYLVTASYGGSSTFSASTSAAVTLNVSQAALTPTTTTLTTTTPTVVIPANEAFTATVASSGTTPTGTVTFLSGSQTIGTATLSNGTAMLTNSTSGLAAGTYTYTASYGGDSTHAASTSGPVTIQVESGATGTTSTAFGIAPNPATSAEAITFYTDVTSASGTPTGTVSFMSGSVTLGITTLFYGTGTYTIPPGGIAGGTYQVTAVYNGASGFATSTSAPVTLNVTGSAASPTTTTLTTTTPTVVVPADESFAVTVTSSGTTPTGTVTLTSGTTTIGSATLSNGTATFTNPTTGLTAGTYSYEASYSGDSTHAASMSASINIVVQNSTLTATTTTLTTTTPTVTIPGNEVLTATVTSTGTTPTGVVNFLYGTTVVGSATLSSGTATLTNSTSGLTAGSYTYTAAYQGDSTHAASTSAPVTIVVSAGTGGTAITVNVNPLVNRHVISPLIYGTNFPPSAAYITATGTTFTRFGGDSASNYNWLTGNSNNGTNYYWENFALTGSSSQLGTALYPSTQGYITAALAAGATPMLSISELPWVAKDGYSASYPVALYGAQCKVDPADSANGDGLETDCATDVTDTSTAENYYPLLDAPGANDPPNSVYRSQWITTLATAFGSATHIYGLDDEPELWSFLHYDVHPAASTYDEMRSLFVTEAPLIKKYDPKALVIGPDDCCWYFYWNLPDYNDKANHASIDFQPWWINEVLWADTISGSRSLDWYDLHAYPDGNSAGYTEAQLAALTLRLPRDFWDPTYVNEGPDVNQIYATMMQPNPTIAFRFPRMRALINSIYPGTPFVLTEWNVNQVDEQDFSTALADVDVYGTFGVQRLYAASRWPAPPSYEPAYWSLVLYRNYDGAGHGFGTTSIQATNNGDPDLFSSYAALNATGTQMTVMLINKDPSNTQTIDLNLGGFTASSLVIYSLSVTDQTGLTTATLTPTNSITLPAYTATLLVMNGTLAAQPATEWDLNPDTTMVPANGSVTIAPKILSGTDAVTLSNPQVIYSNPTSGSISVSIPTPKITTTANGAITIAAGSTPGFYEYSVVGTDSSGVAQTQDGWIFVQNPAATLTKTGDGQSGAPGSTLTLSATLVPGGSGGTPAGGSILFTTSAGTLSAREVTTNSSGVATVTLTLPSTAGTVTVTAEGQYGLGHPVVKFTETSQ
jgi:hypothetical protein